MKFSRLLIVSIVTLSMHAEAQFYGYGLQGGLSACGYQVSQGEEASSYKDEIKELNKQIKDWTKEVGDLKRQLTKEKGELRKHDASLRNNFDSDAYTFVKTHFDTQSRCRDYKGHSDEPIQTTATPAAQVDQSARIGTESKVAPAANELKTAPPPKAAPAAAQKPNVSLLMKVINSRAPASDREPASRGERRGRDRSDRDDDEDDSGDLIVEPEPLNKVWGQVCDKQRNPKGYIDKSICRIRSITGGAKYDPADCQFSVLNYPKSAKQVKYLTKEIEIKQQAIKDAKAQIPDLNKSAREEIIEARRQRIEDIREGGVCVECLGTVSGGASESADPNWGGVIGNSLMALMAYSSSKSFYNGVADRNSNLGYPTQMPMTGSPWMAAAPHIMGAIGAGLGQGGFGCAGSAGGIAGMGGPLGPYAALGGMGQVGGAFGTPAWALGGQLGGGIYNPGVASWGANGPWGLSNTGMGLYPQLMASGQLGYGLPGMSGAIGGGVDPMALALLGQAGGGGLANAGLYGANLMNPYAALGGAQYGIAGAAGIPGIMGLGGAGGIAGLGGLAGGGLAGLGVGGIAGLGVGGLGAGGLGGLGMNQQMMQMQLQQQQQAMQMQMRYYEDAMQKQKAVSGLQAELMGVIQRIQSVQYGVGSTGNNYLGVGAGVSGGFQFGASGGVGGLPGGVIANPPPLTGVR